MFSVHGLTIPHPGRPGQALVTDLSCQVGARQLLAVLGCNGAGKTLTLQTLAGLRAPASGDVRLDGRALAAWPARERARHLGLLAQGEEEAFPATVMECTLAGRHPHLGFWSWEGEADEVAAHAALVACDLAGFEAREVHTLSGGERRRTQLATVLAQDPRVLLLDEPLNHLDPRHQRQLLQLLRERTDRGGSVIASLHDASAAARYADLVLLLYGDGRWDFGPATTVLEAGRLSDLYGVPLQAHSVNGYPVFIET
jgi:iron complex transport system ATP-binding protein